MVPGPTAPRASRDASALEHHPQQAENAAALTRAAVLQGPAGKARNLERRRQREAVQRVGGDNSSHVRRVTGER